MTRVGIVYSVGAVLVTLTPRAMAADGLGIEPLTCGAGTLYGVECQLGEFGEDQYRPPDGRVEKIKRSGYAGSALFSSDPVDQHLLTTATADDAFLEISGGSQVVLQNGSWSGFDGTIWIYGGT